MHMKVTTSQTIDWIRLCVFRWSVLVRTIATMTTNANFFVLRGVYKCTWKMHQVTGWFSMTFKSIIEAALHIITQYQFWSSVAYRLKMKSTTYLCVQEVTSLICSAWWVNMMTSWQGDTPSTTGLLWTIQRLLVDSKGSKSPKSLMVTNQLICHTPKCLKFAKSYCSISANIVIALPDRRMSGVLSVKFRTIHAIYT